MLPRLGRSARRSDSTRSPGARPTSRRCRRPAAPSHPGSIPRRSEPAGRQRRSGGSGPGPWGCRGEWRCRCRGTCWRRVPARACSRCIQARCCRTEPAASRPDEWPPSCRTGFRRSEPRRHREQPWSRPPNVFRTPRAGCLCISAAPCARQSDRDRKRVLYRPVGYRISSSFLPLVSLIKAMTKTNDRAANAA